jgi:hypothetical protein
MTKNKEEVKRVYCKVSEAMQILGIKKRKIIYDMINKGLIEGERISSDSIYLIKIDSLHNLVERLRKHKKDMEG